MAGLAGGGKLSGLIIDADLAMGAHNITLSDTQTVDGQDVSGLMKKAADCDLVMGAHNITLGAGQTVDGKDVSTLAKVATGTYTGNDSVSQDIDTGLSTIKGLIIMPYGNDTVELLLKVTNDPATGSHDLLDGAYDASFFGSGFSGGHFYVDDGGNNGYPNKSATTYQYIAWGT